MNSSVKIGHVLGVPVRIHWTVPLLLVLFGYGLGGQTLPAWLPGASTVAYALAGSVGSLLLLGSLLAHEAAHAVTARKKGIPVHNVTLWALGGMTEMGRPGSAGVALMVAFSGPLTSLVLGGIALGAGAWLHALTGSSLPTAVSVWLGWTNLILGVFNLLPAAPLDGGRVVQAVMWWRTGDRDRAERAAARGGQVLGMLLIAAGWISVLRGALGGLWLAVIGLFVVIVANAERQRARLATAVRGVRAADVMSSPVETCPDWLTVEHGVEDVAMKARHSALPLLDFAGQPSGIVDLSQLAKVPGPHRGRLRVRDVATPLSKCTTCAPDDLMDGVLEKLRPSSGMRILVRDDDHLVGIITARDFSRLVQRQALRSAGSG
ncbi:site-2 protease family protein [Streptomyces sp. NPDC015127]|uniref:site-2 protease family protein n=1 Tax=Streptomyces sp. NPDC015127 TaxID=3364939 RepID=UPI0036F7CCAE